MADTKQQLADLKAKLAKRRNQPGFAENVAHIEREIARMEGTE